MQVNRQDSFIRQGGDVYSTVPLAYTDAVLGGQLEVQTLRGTRKVQVPAGTQHGCTVTLEGQGVPSWGAALPICGAHYVTLHVVLPMSCSPEEMQLLQQLKMLTTTTVGQFK